VGASLDIAAGGTTLAAERHAGAGPAVVLLHAGVCDRRSWREVATLLAGEGLDVVGYDRRGFGETPASRDAFRHLDDLGAVLDTVSPEPVWLVGSSMGGALALDAALELEGRVAGLVLLAPAVSGAPEPEDEAYGEATNRVATAIEAADEAGDVGEVNRLETLLWLDGPEGPEGRVGGEPRERVLAMNGIALASGMDDDAGASGIDAWARLEEIRVPTAVGWGDLDIPVIADRSREVADRVADLRAREVFAGTAHLPYLERPEQVARFIRAAIAGR
jgi:pimeloyl-ACP methyl ester carboxylesterase